MPQPDIVQIIYARMVCSKNPEGIWEAHYLWCGKLWEIPARVSCTTYNQLCRELHTYFSEGSIMDMSTCEEMRNPRILQRRFYRMSSGLVIAEQDFLKEVAHFLTEEPATAKVQEDTCAELAVRFPKYWKSLPKHWAAIDTYRVNELFPIIGDDSGRLLHARKKLLVPGVRTGGKSLFTDVSEAYATLGAWLADNQPAPRPVEDEYEK